MNVFGMKSLCREFHLATVVLYVYLKLSLLRSVTVLSTTTLQIRYTEEHKDLAPIIVTSRNTSMGFPVGWVWWVCPMSQVSCFALQTGGAVTLDINSGESSVLISWTTFSYNTVQKV